MWSGVVGGVWRGLHGGGWRSGLKENGANSAGTSFFAFALSPLHTWSTFLMLEVAQTFVTIGK